MHAADHHQRARVDLTVLADLPHEPVGRRRSEAEPYNVIAGEVQAQLVGLNSADTEDFRRTAVGECGKVVDRALCQQRGHSLTDDRGEDRDSVVRARAIRDRYHVGVTEHQVVAVAVGEQVETMPAEEVRAGVLVLVPREITAFGQRQGRVCLGHMTRAGAGFQIGLDPYAHHRPRCQPCQRPRVEDDARAVGRQLRQSPVQRVVSQVPVPSMADLVEPGRGQMVVATPRRFAETARGVSRSGRRLGAGQR